MGGCSFSGKTSTKSDAVIRFSNNQNNPHFTNHNHSIPENNHNRQGRTSNNVNSYHDNQNSQTINNNSTVKVTNKFQDMEEIDNKFVGEGIKRIKAYKSNFLYDQIDKLREEFYSSKKERIEFWVTIKQACMADPATAEILLSSMNMMCLGENMQCIVEASTGYIFNVPNFCISYPVIMKEIPDFNQIEEKFFKVTLIDVFNNQKHHNFNNISNKLTGRDLKNKFLEKVNKSSDEYNVRLLFKGDEIKNEDILAKFNFDNLNKIQVSCNKKDN